MLNHGPASLLRLIAGCAAFMIAGCQIPSGPQSSSYTTSGEDLGSDIPFQKIGVQASKVAIEGGDPIVISYETRTLSDRVQEKIAIDGGFMFASFMKPDNYFLSNVSSQAYLWQFYVPTLREKRIALQKSDIKTVPYRGNGNLSYVSGTSSDEQCFAFVLAFWKGSPIDTLGQGDTGLRGGVCLPLEDPRAARLEPYMLDLLNRVRFS